MLVLQNLPKAEIVVKRSRFFSELCRVDTVEAAREELKALRTRWEGEGINHLVYAFIVGKGANVVGCSDDGEPSGTAGRPALEVLKGTGMTNVLLTIARIFGGIKLGTGGLVKAYGDSAKAVAALAETTELVPMSQRRLTIPYPVYDRVKLLLAGENAKVWNEEFGQSVSLCFEVREEQLEGILTQCRDLTRGQFTAEELP